MENSDVNYNQNQLLSVEYHRAYRKLHYGSLFWRIVSHLILFGIFTVLVFVFLDSLTFYYSKFAAAILQDHVPALKMSQISLFRHDAWVLVGQGIYPSLFLLKIVAIASVIVLLISIFIRKIPLPIRLAGKVAAFLSLFGCLYFWLWGTHFPYNLNDFSILYLSAEIGMWIAIPAMLVFALMPLPVSIVKKALLILFTLIYTYIFGSLRYALFLFILAKFSYLWMAFLYFIFGAFFDFVFMIAFYSYFISLVAPGIYKNGRIWRWLYSS
ncbi:MAG: hypothetical protein R6V77_01710 [Candidatus Cloacimonadaceae bacterium]